MLKNVSRISWIRKTTATTTTSKPQLATESVTAAASSSSNNIRCLTLATPAATNFSPCHSHKLLLTPTSILVHSNMASSSKEAAAAPVKTNRLANEKSPYLLQHAHNPVDWYPWGEEAIQRSRTENKLIFLSVGYSTCHWCHVMEHESFENKKVASIMNTNFVNIKVDREERPDIDKIYMQFLLMMNGSGGWPMSVWLTPDLAPITAGTYFPPHDRWGMPSFTTVLNTIAGKWISNQEELKTTGLHVIASIQKSLSEKATEAIYKPGSADAKLQEALRIYKQRYDQQHGGFGTQPKFPEISRLNFLFHAYIITKDADVLDMALQTLQHIGRGGIHDHVFGGFSRYAVDREWHVPHFEKMLYDQGQLMSAYAHAYKLTHNETFFRYADGIFRYIMKDLRHPDGGFYAGEDADSLPKASDTTKVEGAFYAWSWDEVKAAITKNAALYEEVKAPLVFEIYAHHYSLQPKGNVDPANDPHGHLHEKNILIVHGSDEKTSEKFDITIEFLHEILKTTNQVLHDIREQRPRPHLDTKIICSWNGLILSGLSKLANCGTPNREEYMCAAEQLFKFMRLNFYVEERKTLLRSCYGVGTNDSLLQSVPAEPIDGFLDDYAFLIKGLLDYYKASLDGSVLEWAKQLQEIQDTIFWDKKHGAYFYSRANAPNVIVRLKEDHDGAEPCGNSVSARNLILFSHYLDDKKYSERARKLFEFFADVNPFGYTLAEMMSALLLHENGLNLIAVVGSDSQITKQFVEVCRKFYIPGMIILHVDPDYEDATYNKRVQQKFKMINGKTTVYICHDKVCRLPVTDPAKLEENLTENFFKGPTF